MVKVIGLMMVKDEVDIIERSLSENSKFVDGLVVLDNGSTDGSLEIIKSHPSVLECIEDREEFDERRLLKVLLKSAERYNADWYLEIDADEIVHPFINGMRYMDLSLYNCITMNIHYMLENRCYKIYRHWARLYKNLGLEKMIDGCEKAVAKLHWGKNPIPRDERKHFHSELPIYHYQMRSPEQIERKYRRYLELDKNAIQSRGYEHFKFFKHALETKDYTGITFYS